MNPSVSIVTPSYRSESFVADTIRSVQSQSVTDWEMIVVDDCSMDHSVDVVQAFVEQDSRIKLIQLAENSGAAVARNVAIEEARGRYIAFLDSDDVWLPTKLEKQLGFMRANGHAFTYSAYVKVDEFGVIFGRVGVPAKVCYTDLLKVSSIGCLTAMYDTEFFGKVYMPLIRKRQDLGLWLRLLGKTKYAFGLNEALAQYRVRANSISGNKVDAAKFTWRLYRDVEGLNLAKAGYYFSHYAARGLLRTKAPSLARFLGILR